MAGRILNIMWIEFQKEKLIGECHEIFTKERKDIRYFVKYFENNLYDLE
jgi:hypothetical protein